MSTDSDEEDIFGEDLLGVVSSDEEDIEEAGTQSHVSLTSLIAPCFQSVIKDRPLEDSRRMSIDRLVSWIISSGGFLHDDISFSRIDGTCNFSGFAKNRLESGKVVVQVPVKCCLSCDDTDIGNLDVNLPSSIQQTDLKQIALACALAHEIRLGEDSLIFPYVASLPTRLDNFPINWTKSDVMALATSEACEQSLRAQAVMLRREYDHLEARNLALTGDSTLFYSFDEYQIAKLLVCSRCFKIGTTVMLLPLIDMLNHHKHPHLRLHISMDPSPSNESTNGPSHELINAPAVVEPLSALSSTEPSLSALAEPALPPEQPDDYRTTCAALESFHGFALSTIRSVSAGDEILNKYGTRNDVSWLLNYGFVPDDGDHEEEVYFTLPLPVQATTFSDGAPPPPCQAPTTCNGAPHKSSSPDLLRMSSEKMNESGAAVCAAEFFSAFMLSQCSRDVVVDVVDDVTGQSTERLRSQRDKLVELLEEKLSNYDDAITLLERPGGHGFGGAFILHKERTLAREVKTALLDLFEADAE